MKFFFAIALLCIGAVAAQTGAPLPGNPGTGRLLVEALEKRGEALLERVKKEIHEHRGNHGHLLSSLEHQAIVVEALVLDIKKQLATPGFDFEKLHHIHVIEEDLLFLENRVSEEIAIIHHFIDGHHQPGHETGPQLVARGERLVKEAKEALVKYPKAKEASELQSEIIIVEALIKAIAAKPTGAELKKDEEELARQERTLRQLIEKATNRKN